MPPPGCGVNTATCARPGFWISVYGTATVITFTFCTTVTAPSDWMLPFHSTRLAFGTNPLPVSVSVKPGCPAVTLDGDRETSDGAGKLMIWLQPGSTSAAPNASHRHTRNRRRKFLPLSL